MNRFINFYKTLSDFVCGITDDAIDQVEENGQLSNI